MKTVRGKSVFGGCAIGKIRVLVRHEADISERTVEDAEAESARFDDAKKKAAGELSALVEKTRRSADEESAKIFEIHQMMLEDLDFTEGVTDIIRNEKLCAEIAVKRTAETLSLMFSEMEDAYMQARSADIRDIADRLIRILSGGPEHEAEAADQTGVIILADDLSPSETASLDKQSVLSFVTRYGSSNSHTAILARAIGIPAVIGADFPDGLDGAEAIVDGTKGLLILDPDEETLVTYRNMLQAEAAQKERLNGLKGKENKTKDGQTIEIFANIAGPDDLAAVIENDAGGIGLFRSEFLYLGKTDYPSEEEQFQAYQRVASDMGGKKVIIRTLDIGADKQADYFGLPGEENPALGFRAIRICLERPELFRTQLRAILRASAFGNIAVMYPMITSVWEVQSAKALFAEAKKELTDQQIPFSEDVEQGVMIETPAAVLIADELAKEVDFFSIGTNDLTQYILAADRQNQKVERFADPHHDAVLKAVRMTVESAHRFQKKTGICGELAADPAMTAFFLKLHVDELSVSPARVLSLREQVRNLDLRM